jgi:hypothetical protein
MNNVIEQVEAKIRIANCSLVILKSKSHRDSKLGGTQGHGAKEHVEPFESGIYFGI